MVPQSIQRRLEEIEVTFKELEEKGVVLERALREEAGKRSPSKARRKMPALIDCTFIESFELYTQKIKLSTCVYLK